MPRKPPGPDVHLTKGDLETFNYIVAYTTIYGRPPSLRELATGRGHASHGPVQRSVNALIAAGKLQRPPGGDLQIPGLARHVLALAELLGEERRSWLSAPERGLVAWRVTADAGQLRAGDVVFARTALAEVGELALAYVESRRKTQSGYLQPVRVYRIHRVTKEVHTRPDGEQYEFRARGPIQIVGPLRYVQRQLNV